MKQRALVALFVVPLVLMGVALWVQRVSWERMEEGVRQEMLSGMMRGGGTGWNVSVARQNSRGDSQGGVGAWTPGEVRSIVSDIHLVHRSSGAQRLFDENWVYIDAPPYFLELSLDSNTGRFRHGGTGQGNDLDSLALAPQTCRALKARIFARWSWQVRTTQEALDELQNHSNPSRSSARDLDSHR